MNDAPPDIVLLGPAWRARALLRAQLVDEGFDVVATDEWPIPRRYLRRSQQPRLLIVDLQGLTDPRMVLDEVAALIPPDRVLVITALGATAPEEVRRRGFHVVTRPATIGQVVARAAALLRLAPRS
jgi:DNA-binding response OmpR family regulator